MRRMRLLWVSVGVFSVLTSGFILYLMIGLAQFEGYRPRQIEIVDAAASEPTPHKPRMSAAPGARPGGGTRAKADDPETVRVNLRRLLQRLQRTPQPARRVRLLAQAKQRREEFEPHLLDILGDTEDTLLIPAIEVVATLDLKTANLQLMILADTDKPATRIAAIRAKSAIDPWSIHDVERLLRDRDTGVVLAALELATMEAERPVDKILRLLGHEVAGVRNAAAKAIPVLPPGAALEALCAMTRKPGAVAWAATKALGKPGFSDRAEACLAKLLDHENASLRRAAIRALGRRGTVLGAAVPALLRTVEDPKRPLRERVAALQTFEQTGTAPESLRTTERSLHAVLRYHAARCFLKGQVHYAMGVFIELLEVAPTAGLSEGQALCVRAESAAMLRVLTGQHLGPTRSVWRRWHRRHPRFAIAGPVPAPPRAW